MRFLSAIGATVLVAGIFCRAHSAPLTVIYEAETETQAEGSSYIPLLVSDEQQGDREFDATSFSYTTTLAEGLNFDVKQLGGATPTALRGSVSTVISPNSLNGLRVRGAEGRTILISGEADVSTKGLSNIQQLDLVPSNFTRSMLDGATEVGLNIKADNYLTSHLATVMVANFQSDRPISAINSQGTVVNARTIPHMTSIGTTLSGEYRLQVGKSMAYAGRRETTQQKNAMGVVSIGVEELRRLWRNL